MALSAAGMIGVIALLHIVGWLTLVAVVVPQHLSLGAQAFGIGIGITAYTLGIRHAFDADHIAAIDNTTRKLVGEGRRPISVGFWFSFGHSTVVFIVALLLTLGIRSLSTHIADANSTLHAVTDVIGTVVSSCFLYVIAALNLFALAGIWRVHSRLRQGEFDEAALEKQLAKRGFINRALGPVMQLLTHPAQMYFVGFLFGLGFDTATEVALLMLSSSGAASGLPWYATLCLPVLFAAGMILFDTLDGSFMNTAYQWALKRPVRKVYYNLIVTGLSVLIAFIIGTVEVLGLLSEKFQSHGRVWTSLAALDLSNIGIIVVVLFVATWAISTAIWKFGNMGQRLSTVHPPDSD
ncbi:HoxN/HupN/NixA family nickel/cobalt transporter [Paraburkholderia pallida]|uniref:Nickel/cobalt efflux system n=2 Tax=Paraburkholderia pallida TaxID=2547399 RepID=A0A4V1B0T6_9BURK|nr:HoxN/HupN/NixA family nickel/cobalt transporter [Paraburkholderia pallida]